MKITFLIILAFLNLSGCKTVSDVMPFDQWKQLIETEKAVLVYNPEYYPSQLLTVKYHGFYNEKRYKLSDGRGGLSLYHFWWLKMQILDPTDGRLKKLERGDWEITVYPHKDINGNIVEKYNK